LISTRKRISSNGKFENIVGYSRALKAGNLIFVSGTTGVDSNGELVSSDAHAQAKKAIENIETALRKGGSSLDDVVRTRVFVTQYTDWKEVARVHKEAFDKILPASSMLVCNFLDPRILVELEADAIVHDE
jgi:enamine deaminase RidA (YjgF/YER057c/UK114 family)